MAATYLEADLARRVTDATFEVQWLTEGGQHPTDLADTAELRRRAAAARLILTSGPGDYWAIGDIGTDSRARRVVEPDRMPSLTRADAAPGPDASGYLWLDPRVAADMVDAVAERLTVVDPGRARAFQASASAARTDLLALDAEVRAGLGGLAKRKVLVVRPAWAAMCRRYGLEQLAPVMNIESKLTDADYKALIAAARQAGLSTLFVDLSTPMAVRQQIAQRTGLKVVPLDATGTSAPNGNSTYEKVMRYNVAALKGGVTRND